MTRDDFIAKYWKYYLTLERDFISTLEYVEFEPENFRTFSNRYSMLIQAVGAELDSFFKEFCGLASDSFSNIGVYAEKALQIWPEIRNQRIEFIEKRTFLQPFKDWDRERAKQSLSWWEAYDSIKHSRADNEKLANLLNAATILAALYMLEMKQLSIICNGEEPDIPDDPSRLFEPEDWDYRFLPCGEGYAFVNGSFCMVNTRRVHWDSRK